MILVFGYDNYYPCGGVNDLRWKGKTIEEFEKVLETDMVLSKELRNVDNVEIYDTETEDIYSLEFEETKIKTTKFKG
jgi:hypothetical protein